MEIVKIDLKEIMKHVYTAKQCSDIADCDTAIAEAKLIRNIYPSYYSGITRRIVSLQNRRDEIMKKRS